MFFEGNSLIKRYVFFGAITTSIHIITSLIMMEYMKLTLITSHVLSYSICVFISYTFNCFFVFKTKSSVTRLNKFILMSLIFLILTIVTKEIFDDLELNHLISSITIPFTYSVISFLIMRLIIFKPTA